MKIENGLSSRAARFTFVRPNPNHMFSKSSLFLWSVIGLFLIISSCKKDDDKPSGGGGTPLAPVSRMTATIGGVSWASDSTEFSYFLVNNDCVESEGIAQGGLYQVLILIEDEIAAGRTYSLGPFGGNVKARIEVIDTIGNIYLTDRPGGSGQIIVTSYDAATRSISLAFSCTLEEISGGSTLVVSGGNFTYRPYFGPVSGNSFSALMNGVPFPTCSSFGINDTEEGQVVIIGQTGDGNYFELYLPNSVSGGITLPLPGVGEIYASDGTLTLENADITGGSIVIASHNKSARRISGTFSVQGTDQSTGAPVSITQGAFNITYQDFSAARSTGNHVERHFQLQRYTPFLMKDQMNDRK